MPIPSMLLFFLFYYNFSHCSRTFPVNQSPEQRPHAELLKKHKKALKMKHAVKVRDTKRDKPGIKKVPFSYRYANSYPNFDIVTSIDVFLIQLTLLIG